MNTHADGAYREREERERLYEAAPDVTTTSAGRELTIGPLGSRSSMLHIEQIVGGVIVETGCFKGTLEAFEKQVSEVHGGDNYGQEYGLALRFIRQWLDMKLAQETSPDVPTGIEPARRL